MADLMEAPARAIRKIREKMTEKHLSQRDLAGIVGWSQSRVAKLLTGRVDLGVNDLEGLCFGVGLTLTEAVRDDGYEFCAEMTPTELRVLEAYRSRPEPVRAAINTLLDVRVPSLAAKPPKLTNRARR